MNITHHTQLLNELISRYGLKSYLEIGINNPANNFDKINCERKHGVDPEIEPTHQIHKMTSDEYFQPAIPPGVGFDLIFIDGLHHCDQVKRDFENSLRCLSDNGFIVIHDTLPDAEEFTTVPRRTRRWFGTVYQFIPLLWSYDDIEFTTLDIDCGCTIVWKDPTKKALCGWDELPGLNHWGIYTQNKKESHRIASVEKFFNEIAPKI